MKKATHKNVEVTHVVREDAHLVHALISIPLFETYNTKEEATLTVLSEMLTSGSGKYTREGFTDALLNLGATLKVSCGEGELTIILTATETEIKKVLSLLTLMLKNPRFEAKELVRIKKHSRNMLPLLLEDARSRAYDTFVSHVVHPQDIRFEVAPNILVEMIQNISLSDVKKLHKKLLMRNRTVTIGGSPASVALVEKMLKTKNGEHAPHVYFENQNISNREVFLINIPHKQNIEFTLGAPLPLLPTDTEYPAFIFGMNVLGLQGGFAGRLMSTVREREGLTYSIYGKVDGVSKTQHGFWRIMTFFNPKDAMKGVTATLREVSLMQKKGITKSELVRFKAIMNTRRALKQDSLIAQISELHSLKLLEITPSEYDSLYTAIANLTVEEVNKVMKKYLDVERIVVSGAGPVKSIEKELQTFQG
jgi:zinc protease